tara:strand:- start:1865 stop:2818 length:954 start_codon:yes stop_codon:yes gene_type:complete
MKILITGVAGFIGYSLANKLIKKHQVIGIDNFDNYYSVSLKKERVKLLNKSKNFKFSKIDISNEKKLKNFLKNKKFNQVIHLAAQVGVRYCKTNPSKYIKTNITGYFNLLNNLNYTNLKKIIYASSSSVYGDKKKFPIKETEKLNPKNIYGLSKKFNEQISDLYSNKVNLVGLRFFTVYGTWGRPDMFFIKILKSIINNEKFNLHNNGNHYRDFTFIDDVVNLIEKLTQKKPKHNHEIYNICSQKPILIKDLVKKIEKKFGKSSLINQPLNNLEMIKTHGNNSRIKKVLGYKKFQSIDYGLEQTINWFKAHKHKIKF